ncbi:MAG TPA: winged helix-turn-helix transcriptional regulator [Candidatus Thermoplasmatota archaeon]|nr:winged helix-turn-helix transcriptional regulator [Candidatus Thermoplasmatota archaeon]
MNLGAFRAISGASLVTLGLATAGFGACWFAVTSHQPQGNVSDEDLAESIYTAVWGFVLLACGVAMLAWPLARWRGVLFGAVTGASGASVACWFFGEQLLSVKSRIDELGQFADAHEFALAIFGLHAAGLALGAGAAFGALLLASQLPKFRWGGMLLCGLAFVGLTSALALFLVDSLGHGGVLWPEVAPIAGAVLAVGTAAWNTAAAAGAVAGAEWRRIFASAFMPLFSRQQPSEALQHEARRTVMEAVRSDPGIHARAAHLRTKLGLGSVVYHLEVLERSGHVFSYRRGRERRYFPAGDIVRADAPRIAVLRHATAKAILAEVTVGRATTQAGIARQLGMSPSLVGWHASRMVEAGVLATQRQGRTVRYRPLQTRLA